MSSNSYKTKKCKSIPKILLKWNRFFFSQRENVIKIVVSSSNAQQPCPEGVFCTQMSAHLQGF